MQQHIMCDAYKYRYSIHFRQQRWHETRKLCRYMFPFFFYFTYANKYYLCYIIMIVYYLRHYFWNLIYLDWIQTGHVGVKRTDRGGLIFAKICFIPLSGFCGADVINTMSRAVTLLCRVWSTSGTACVLGLSRYDVTK